MSASSQTTPPLTEQQLAEIQERVAHAHDVAGRADWLLSQYKPVRAALADVPALLAEVKRLKGEFGNAVATVARLELKRVELERIANAERARVAELEAKLPTPQTPTRRPVDPNSKAAWLGRLIEEKFPKDAMTEPVDGETLTVYVTPASLGDWDWWLGRFHIPTGQTTHRGSYSTAKGNHGSVKVLLTGHGVPALYAAEAAGGAL